MMFKELYILLALAVTLASCGEKHDEDTLHETNDNTSLSFIYESYRFTAQSRAIAQDHEKVVHDLDIFAFAADGSYLGQLTENSDYTEIDNGDHTSTITATLAFLQQYAGESLTFYFVGNNAASLVNSAASETKHISTFSGTESQFREQLSLPLADTWDGKKAEYIQLTPNSGGLLMSGRAAVTLDGQKKVNIDLKRRTARFDIINPAPDNFKISAIYISDAAVQGPLFGNAQEPHTIPLKSLLQIDRPGLGDNAHVTYEQESEKQYRAAGVFYLYPTTLGQTNIVIQGYFGNNITKKYNFPVIGNIDIVANNRYTLMFDEQTAEIITNLGDYVDGEGNIIIGL